MNVFVLCKWIVLAIVASLLVLWHPRFTFAGEAPACLIHVYAKKSPEIFPEIKTVEACVPVPTNLARQLYENTPYRVLYFTQIILELMNQFAVDVVRVELSESEVCIYYAPHTNNYSATYFPPHS